MTDNMSGLRQIAERIDWRQTRVVVTVGYPDAAEILREYRKDLQVVEYIGKSAPGQFEMELGKVILPGDKVEVIADKGHADLKDKVVAAIKSAQRMIGLADHSRRKNALHWAVCGAKNLRHMAGRAIANYAKPELRGVPAVIVGAGPGLTKNINVLGRLQEHVCIIATDAAMGPLIDHKIQPHVVCTLESSELALSATRRSTVWDAAHVVVGPHAHESAWSVPSKQKSVALIESGAIGRWLCSEINPPKVQTGGSVSHICAQMALLMGCSPLVLVGMDCGWQHSKMYADGVRHDWVAKDPASSAIVPGWRGKGKCKTNAQLNLYRLWFESMALEIGMVNATESGAHIGNTVEVPLSAVESEVLLGADRHGPRDVPALVAAAFRDLPVLERDPLRKKLAEHTEKHNEIAKISNDAVSHLSAMQESLHMLSTVAADSPILGHASVPLSHQVRLLPTMEQLNALREYLLRINASNDALAPHLQSTIDPSM